MNTRRPGRTLVPDLWLVVPWMTLRASTGRARPSTPGEEARAELQRSWGDLSARHRDAYRNHIWPGGER